MRSVPELRTLSDRRRAADGTIGPIGAGGGLHDGHLSLVRESVKAGDFTVLWLFCGSSHMVEAGTTPSYVRDYDGDQRAALEAGAAVVFRPPNETMKGFGLSDAVTE
jgi:pantoate--beta-alanine ligase